MKLNLQQKAKDQIKDLRFVLSNILSEEDNSQKANVEKKTNPMKCRHKVKPLTQEENKALHDHKYTQAHPQSDHLTLNGTEKVSHWTYVHKIDY